MNYMKLMAYAIILCWVAATFILTGNASAGYLLTSNALINFGYYVISMITIATIVAIAIEDSWGDKK